MTTEDLSSCVIGGFVGDMFAAFGLGWVEALVLVNWEHLNGVFLSSNFGSALEGRQICCCVCMETRDKEGTCMFVSRESWGIALGKSAFFFGSCGFTL